MLTLIEALDEQLGLVEGKLRRFSRSDRRCLALQTIFGVGPIYSCHLLAEIGEASRFKRSRQLVRASGLDPAALESAANKRRSPALPTGLATPPLGTRRSGQPQHAHKQSRPPPPR